MVPSAPDLTRCPQLDHRGVEAALERDAECDLGLVDRGQCGVGAGDVECERFFRVDVLAGSGRLEQLLGVLGVGRRQDDRVDLGIGEQLLVAGLDGDAFGLGIGLGLGRGARVAGGDADHVARALDAVDQHLAPPSHSDDARADHAFPPVSSNGEWPAGFISGDTVPVRDGEGARPAASGGCVRDGQGPATCAHPPSSGLRRRSIVLVLDVGTKTVRCRPHSQD